MSGERAVAETYSLTITGTEGEAVAARDRYALLDTVALQDEAVRAGWMESAHYRRADDVPGVAL